MLEDNNRRSGVLRNTRTFNERQDGDHRRNLSMTPMKKHVTISENVNVVVDRSMHFKANTPHGLSLLLNKNKMELELSYEESPRLGSPSQSRKLQELNQFNNR